MTEKSQVKLYAVATRAALSELHLCRTKIETSALAALAHSKEEALGLGLNKARERWPSQDGWHNHNVTVFQIPDQMLLAAIGEVLGETA